MIRITEETKSKRISHYKEFDNGHVLHGNWKNMTSDEAEEIARKKSLEDPNDIFYVQYDDVMNPSSDLRWINGKSYDLNHVSVRISNGKPVVVPH